MGWLVLLQGIHLFYVITIAILLFRGTLTWLLTRTPSVGASDVIFGYMGFLLVYGAASGDPTAVITTVFASIWYGWMIRGIFPGNDPRTAWASHLFGFIGGMLLALWLGDMRQSHYFSVR